MRRGLMRLVKERWHIGSTVGRAVWWSRAIRQRGVDADPDRRAKASTPRSVDNGVRGESGDIRLRRSLTSLRPPPPFHSRFD